MIELQRLELVSIDEGASLLFYNGKGASDTELLLQANTILIRGYLEIGREESLFTRKARIVLSNTATPISRYLLFNTKILIPFRITDFELSADDLVAGPKYGQKLLAVYDNGRLEIHGQGRKITWTKLDGDISKNDTVFQVIDNVDWKVGDKLIIATTDHDMYQTEERTIVSINNRVITVNTPFKYRHFGRVVTYDGYSLDMRAEVGVLTSNVVIEVRKKNGCF